MSETISKSEASWIIENLKHTRKRGELVPPKFWKGFTYLSIYRPIGHPFPVKGNLTPDNPALIQTDRALSVSEIVSLELAPFSRDAKVAAMKDVYAADPEAREGRYEIIIPMDAEGRGVAIAPSAKEPGGWQATHFSEYGFTGDMQYSCLEEALAASIYRGYVMPMPGHLRDMMELPEFQVPDDPAPSGP